MCGVGALNAVLFGTYTAAKRLVTRGQGGEQTNLWQVMACGAFTNYIIRFNVNVVLTIQAPSPALRAASSQRPSSCSNVVSRLVSCLLLLIIYLKVSLQVYMTAEQAKLETSTVIQAKNVVKAKGLMGLMTGFWITAARDVPRCDVILISKDF